MRMVNDGFPDLIRYGFEMVDVSGGHISRRKSRQSKIYTESNQSDFSQIFGDLTPTQALAIYRRLLIKV
jgi:hypothetical protein